MYQGFYQLSYVAPDALSKVLIITTGSKVLASDTLCVYPMIHGLTSPCLNAHPHNEFFSFKVLAGSRCYQQGEGQKAEVKTSFREFFLTALL